MTADTGSTGAVSTATIIAWLTVFRDLVTANNAYLTDRGVKHDSRHGCGGRAGRFCCTGEHRGAFHIGGDDVGENRGWRERSAVRHLLPALRFSDPGRCNTA